jgi:ABC-2 type transport system permease protein
MATAPLGAGPAKRRDGLAYGARVLRVVTTTQFKQKYSDSALGYVWSLAKPLALFGVLYYVFGRIFRIGTSIHHYPLYLLAGIVCWVFVVEATHSAAGTIPQQASLLRRLAFPRVILPLSVTLTATITFLLNLVAVAVFVAGAHLHPHWNWFLLLPLLLELYVVVLGISLILCTLFVRFRDVAHIWDLATSLLFYSSPIIYPVDLLPHTIRAGVFANPVVQIIQDVRSILLPGDGVVTASDELGGNLGRLVPLGVALGLLAAGALLFKREEPWFAERL